MPAGRGARMTDAAEVDFIAAGAPVDLDNCAREPIHVPGICTGAGTPTNFPP